TDATGTKALKNMSEGVLLNFGATNNTIGGSSIDSRNIISGNGSSGVFIGSIGGANHNTVAGNFLGTDVTGTMLLPNGEDGVRVVSDVGFTASDNTLTGNLIKGNLQNGIGLFASDRNVIQGNDIEQNSQVGVSVGGGPAASGSTDNVIGGPASGQRNIISGNGTTGVTLSNTTQTTIQGNYLGTDAS